MGITQFPAPGGGRFACKPGSMGSMYFGAGVNAGLYYSAGMTVHSSLPQDYYVDGLMLVNGNMQELSVNVRTVTIDVGQGISGSESWFSQRMWTSSFHTSNGTYLNVNGGHLPITPVRVNAGTRLAVRGITSGGNGQNYAVNVYVSLTPVASIEGS